MTSNCYIIDSSSLIGLNKGNPIDVYPSVWQKLESLINRGSLLAPKEVLFEIMDGDDQLASWAKHHRKLFVEPTPKQLEILKSILKDYPSLVKEHRKHDADAWVIALTIEMAAQKSLLTIKRIVVTEEKLRGNQVKIPFVCQKYSIEAIDIIDMFRLEGWKF